MNDTPIFLHYTRSALDREYDNRSKVPDSAQQIDWFSARSRTVRDALEGIRDVRYGPAAAETLDIFGAGGRDRAVNVFFHGGYWKAMHKDDFSFVAAALVPSGAISVVVNYALIPAVDMSELVAQCRRAMIWVYHNIAGHGGDPSRIHASGHSAGGHLVAMMMATDWPELDPACPQSLVSGGLGISGLYDLEPIRLCFLNEDLGLDAQSVARNSPVRLEKLNPGPLELVVGGAEGDEYERQSRELAARWPDTRVHVLAGRDHFSIMRELGSADGEPTRLVRTMMGVP